MKKRYSKAARAFSIPHQTWYAETSVKPYHENEYMYIGFYYENGTEGEFRLEWNNVGIQLKVYDDSWEALSKMPELMELLAKLSRENKTPSINEFAEMLKELGYKDRTERE